MEEQRWDDGEVYVDLLDFPDEVQQSFVRDQRSTAAIIPLNFDIDDFSPYWSMGIE